MATEPVTLLERLRELDEKATPGPWTITGADVDEEMQHLTTPSGHWIVDVPSVGFQAKHNAALAAAARNALPAVVALVKAAQDAERTLVHVSTGHDPKHLRSSASQTLDEIRASLAPFVSTQEAVA